MTFVSANHLYRNGMYWTATNSGVIDGSPYSAGDRIFASGDPTAPYLTAAQTTFTVQTGAIARLDVVRTGTATALVGSAIVGTSVVGGGPSWQEVSAYVRRVEIDYPGRQREINQYGTGNARIILDNTDGRFSPFNTSGPYYPSLRPLAAIQVAYGSELETSDRWSAPVFTGIITDFEEAYVPGSTDATVTITAYDPTSLLAIYDGPERQQQGANELSGARIRRILHNADLPSWVVDETNIDQGARELQSTNLARNALAEAKLTADSEAGLLYALQDGSLRYKGNQYWVSKSARTPKLCFHDHEQSAAQTQWEQFDTDNSFASETSDENNYVQCRQIMWSYDADFIKNMVSFARANGTAQTVTDAVSRALYRDSPYSRSDLLNSTDDDVRSLALQTLRRFAHPKQRANIAEVSVTSLAEATRLSFLSQPLGQSVIVHKQINDFIDTAIGSYMDGIRHIITPDSWTSFLNFTEQDTTLPLVVGRADRTVGDTNVVLLSQNTADQLYLGSNTWDVL